MKTIHPPIEFGTLSYTVTGVLKFVKAAVFLLFFTPK